MTSSAMNAEIEQQLRQLGDLLIRRTWMLVTAESCTGGGVAHAVTAIAGSSGWFERGFVTYSNLAKQQMLDVPAAMLQRQGAVSEAVVRAMAEGALRNSAAHVSVAISGIAGPDGGSPDKPVGTVWFAWAVSQRLTRSQCRHFAGDRAQVRQQAVETAVTGLLDVLRSADDEGEGA